MRWNLGARGLGLAFAPLLMATTVGCDSRPANRCQTTEEFFAESVWAPIFAKKCILCHNRSGDAAERNAKFILQESSEPNFLAANLEMVRSFARVTDDGVPRILAKPTNTSVFRHGGGVQIVKGGVEYDAMVALVDRLGAPEQCAGKSTDIFDGVELATPDETLRKASISLVGRLPTEAEATAVAEKGLGALEPVLDAMMTEEAFYTRLKEIYNDLFLTDRYTMYDRAIGLMRDEEYPQRRWFDTLTRDKVDQLTQRYGFRDPSALRAMTNEALAREPLELIAHVVRENRPFTEIVTANYTVVSPLSARAYGMDPDVSTALHFNKPNDPREFAEAIVKIGKYDLPHAGVLSSPMFLNRYPTTPTNRNRGRARVVYQLFLATDILQLSEQPVDPSKLKDEDNPTMHEQYCKGCHAMIDPVAGTFASWDFAARYYPDVPWYRDMRQPGFGDRTLKDSGTPLGRGLPWVGAQIAKDERFPIAAVFTIYTGLTGQNPLSPPKDPAAPDFGEAFRSYLAQNDVFRAIARAFVDSNYNLRVVVKGVVMSPYFRAKSAPPQDAHGKALLADVGMARLLTPEQLNRKVTAVIGYPWRYSWSSDLLLNQYRTLYGGIDSDTIVQRITQPNGLMATVAERMATEMSCWSTARDFAAPPAERRLFPFVQPDTVPEDATEHEVPEATAAIRKNIQHLHRRILGEKLALNDPQIQATFDLYMATWRELKAKHGPGLNYWCGAYNDYWTGTKLAKPVDSDPNLTIRSWMAVLGYLLSDYKFLYE